MPHRSLLTTVVAAIVFAVSPCFAQSAIQAEDIGRYSAGGRNVVAHKYMHSKGYPPFPDRAKFIGTLTGNWYDMGKRFGERSGAEVRFVSDILWAEQCDKWGKVETLRAMGLYKKQIQEFDPGMIEFMRGIADGASQWLAQSPYAAKTDPLHSTHYERVLAVNIYDEWTMRHPRHFPDGSSTYGGSAKSPPDDAPKACGGFSARGKATTQGQVIAAQNRQYYYNPRCYEQVYAIRPAGGLACWVLTNCPQVAANQVVNERGVSLALFAGGVTNARSLNHGGKAYYAEGFGVPWFHLFLYAGTHAKTAEEAIEILTVGTREYRDRTGRKTLLRGGGWLFLVTDEKTMKVVEATADRYAIRRPGEYTGEKWTDRDYIVATNHNLCDYSYDATNRRTDVPMTIFGDGFERDPSTGEKRGLNESGVRFWTLMWDMKHHYGQIDSYAAQAIMSGLYAYDERGEKLEAAQDRHGKWRVWGTVGPCNQGLVSLDGGTLDGKVAVSKEGQTAVYWTMGSPSHWQGAWDTFHFGK